MYLPLPPPLLAPPFRSNVVLGCPLLGDQRSTTVEYQGPPLIYGVCTVCWWSVDDSLIERVPFRSRLSRES